MKAADLAKYLRREFSPSESDQAQKIITAIELEIARRCRRPFAITLSDEEIVYSEYFDLPGKTFFTAGFPIKNIEAININAVDAGLVANADYYIYDDAVVFEFGTFNHRLKKGLEIQYTIEQFWGEDLVIAILKLAGVAWLNAEDGGVAKTELGFASIRQAYDLPEFNKHIDQVVNSYKKRLI